MSEWQPIETAPKNMPIIGYSENCGYSIPLVFQCVFDNGEWWPDCWEYKGEAISLMLWMPIPPLPKKVA